LRRGGNEPKQKAEVSGPDAQPQHDERVDNHARDQVGPSAGGPSQGGPGGGHANGKDAHGKGHG
jgi:hypothetical protein